MSPDDPEQLEIEFPEYEPTEADLRAIEYEVYLDYEDPYFYDEPEDIEWTDWDHLVNGEQ